MILRCYDELSEESQHIALDIAAKLYCSGSNPAATNHYYVHNSATQLKLVLIFIDSGVDLSSTDCYYRSCDLTSSSDPLWDKVLTFLDIAADNGFLDITKLF